MSASSSSAELISLAGQAQPWILAAANGRRSLNPQCLYRTHQGGLLRTGTRSGAARTCLDSMILLKLRSETPAWNYLGCAMIEFQSSPLPNFHIA